MVKPEKFGHLCLVYHFTIPLRVPENAPNHILLSNSVGKIVKSKSIFCEQFLCGTKFKLLQRAHMEHIYFQMQTIGRVTPWVKASHSELALGLNLIARIPVTFRSI